MVNQTLLAPRFCLGILLVAALLAATGCQPPPSNVVGNTPPAPVDRADEVALFAMPTAINWDNRPGADGLEVQVNFFLRSQSLPVMVKGQIDFLCFAGRIGGDIESAKPLLTWSFPQSELRSHIGQNMAGWDYTFRLPWPNGKAPKESTVTVVARHQPPTGDPLYSTPVSVALSLK